MYFKNIFILFATLAVVKSQCQQINLRKEIRELSDSEYNSYVDAALKVYTRPSPNIPSKLENLTKLHYEGGMSGKVHSNPAFLPWHRKFIREYELALQEVNPTVNLPYWDWTQEADFPHRSPVLTPLYMGGNGNPDMNFILDNGPFKFQNLLYKDNHTLSRNYDGGNKLGAFANRVDINKILSYGNFSDFAKRLEFVHGTPHVRIGNDKDFGDNRASNDPLFFLHHAFVDLIWAKWQLKFNESNQYEGTRFNRVVSVNDTLYGYDKSTVGSTLDFKGTGNCYDYPEYPRNISPSRTNSTANVRRSDIVEKGNKEDIVTKKIKNLTYEQSIKELTKLESKYKYRMYNYKKPTYVKMSTLPDYWIKMHNYDLNEVRSFEAQINQLRELRANLATIPNLNEQL